MLNHPRWRRPVPGAASPAAVLLPGAGVGEWEVLRPPTAGDGQPEPARQVCASLEAAALLLAPGEAFVLEAPLELGLIQRFVLPAAEPAEIEEMARIQLEKILPYAADSIGLTFAEVSRDETEVILAVEALHHDRLVMLCEPLAARGCWPARVLFHARAVAAAVGGDAAFICGEHGKIVLGIAEAGRLSFAQALSGGGPAELAAELPAVLLGAELEGLPTNFAAVRLDARCAEARAALEVSLGMPVDMFSSAVAALPVAGAAAGDLSPPGWRNERLRVEKIARLKRRVLAGAAVYIGLLVLGLLALGALKLRLTWLKNRVAAVQPAAEAAQQGELRWKTMAPAVDPASYVIETLWQVYDCLPPGDIIRLTSFDSSLGTVGINGEAPSPAAAVEFTEKLKARPELQKYHLNAAPLTILPNGHAKFGVSGGGS